MLRVYGQMHCILVLESYPDPPPSLSEILYPPLMIWYYSNILAER